MHERLYETDYVAWTEQQVQVLKAGKLEELDRDGLIEALEGFGRMERRVFKETLRKALAYLLKIQFSHVSETRQAWLDKLQGYREEIEFQLADTPSLLRHVDRLCIEAWPQALASAQRALEHLDEDVSMLPAVCPYTAEQVLRFNYVPE